MGRENIKRENMVDKFFPKGPPGLLEMKRVKVNVSVNANVKVLDKEKVNVQVLVIVSDSE